MASFHSLSEFNIVRELGRGGFGRALFAECQSDLAEYVLKEVNLTKIAEMYSDDPTFAAKIVDVCSKEHEKVKPHPNIVRVYTSFQETHLSDDPQPRMCNFYYLVMEYCEGGDLESVIRDARRNNQPFEEEQIRTWSKHLASALKHLHSHNIFHRDIKPKNVFLTSNRTLKLGDFGTAKSVSSETIYVSPTSAIATWQYAAPEMCQRGEYSEKSDIWSLGVLIYETVNLKRPFVGDGPELFRRICMSPPDPFQYADRYSADLQNFVLAMLDKDPANRPNTDRIFGHLFLLRTRMRVSPVASVPLISNICNSNVQQQQRSNSQSGQRSNSQSAGLAQRDATPSPPATPLPRVRSKTSMPAAAENSTPATSPENSRNRNSARGLLGSITPRLMAVARELLNAIERCDLAKIRDILGSDSGRQLLATPSIWWAPPPPFEMLTSHGDSPLHRAARFNSIEAVQTLVNEFDWPLEMRNARGNFAIHTAIGAGHLRVVEFLLERQPDLLEAKGRYDRTLLIQAVLSNSVPITKYLIQRGADLKARTSHDDHRSMAVHYAAAYGYSDALAILLDCMPDLIEEKDSNLDTPLNRAASSGRVDVVQLLVKKYHACVENRNSYGRTPFLQAAVSGHVKVATFLAEEGGANVNAVDSGKTHDSAIHLASCFGHQNIVEFLLEKWPEMINKRNICNDNVMNLAALGGQVKLVSYLLAKAEADAKLALLENHGEHDYTPLMQAASNGRLDVVKLLVENGADLEAAESKQGNTAIHLAAHFGCFEVVRYLAGLNYRRGNVLLMDLKNNNGHSPLSIAKNANHNNIAQMLLQAGAKSFNYNASNNPGACPNNPNRSIVKCHSRFFMNDN